MDAWKGAYLGLQCTCLLLEPFKVRIIFIQLLHDHVQVNLPFCT